MIRLIQRVGLAAAILFIPHGLWGQLTPAERVPWVGDTLCFGTGAFLLAGSVVYRLAH